MDSAFQTLKPWIRHCHFHDGTATEPYHLTRIGEGVIDHRRAVKLLQGMHYDGYLSGEWIDFGPYEDYLAGELAMMKSYER